MRAAQEIGRILISLMLLVMAGFLFWCSMRTSDIGTAKGMGDTAGVIIGGNLTYWLAPRVQAQ
jgi:hypothetical protein